MVVESPPLVLVVEDNAAAARLFSLQLGAAGYRVVRVSSGEAALAAAAAEAPALVLLDLLLPGLDGWEVLAQLKAAPATRDIPVVIVSVLDRQPLGFQLGAAEHLVKPVARERLLAAVARVLRRSAGTGRVARVLVMDEMPRELERIAAMLRPAGFEVLAATGSAEGLGLARRLRPDVVLVDLLFGGHECLEAITELRTDAVTAGIPLLVLRGKRMSAAQKARLTEGVHTVLIEGTEDEQTLVRIIGELVVGEREAGT